ncbi:hypothetical protein FOG51_00758 [Hanseniaspora uvarum]|nr:hypothetical protein FOG51_00758 [Hanseniaspora uvarum]
MASIKRLREHFRRNSKLLNIALLIFTAYYFIIYSPFSTLGKKQAEVSHYFLPKSLNAQSTLYKPVTVDSLKQRSGDFDLRSLMDLEFPYDPLSSTPKFIWQTHKNDPATDPNFRDDHKLYMKSWQKKLKYDARLPMDSPQNGLKYSDPKNNEWIYYYLNDKDVNDFVENTFANLEPIVWAFKSLPIGILKADFFRYLIIYARGGIYSDVDTTLMKSLPDWAGNNYQFIEEMVKNPADRFKYKGPDTTEEMPPAYNMLNTPGLVVGIEADADRPDWAEFFARRVQLCQWTIQSKPGHPVLREVILNITSTTLASSSLVSSKIKSKIKFDQDHIQEYKIQNRHKHFQGNEQKTSKNVDGTDIMNWTGPGLFTDTICEYLEYLINNYKSVNIFNKNLNIEHHEGDDDSRKSTKKFHTRIVESFSKLRIDWGFYSLMQRPILIADVAILPITAFSPDVGHMGAKSSNSEDCYVKHHFSGSWKG